MSMRIAINGFGRIGMDLLKIIHDNKEDIDVIAINSNGNPDSDIPFFVHDPLHGTYKGNVNCTDGSLDFDGNKILYFHEKDVCKLPWKDLNVDIVIDTCGKSADKHISAGAKKVIITSPADKPDAKIVMGINQSVYNPEKHSIISLMNPAINCIAPIVSIIHKMFYILKGNATIIEPYSGVDAFSSDLNATKISNFSMAAGTSDIRTIGCILPELQGKFNGISLIAPTYAVSLADINMMVGKQTNVVGINEYLKEMAAGPYNGIIAINEKQLPSSNYNGNMHSAIVEPRFTTVSAGNMIKILAAYDEDYGYCSRIIDFIKYIASK